MEKCVKIQTVPSSSQGGRLGLQQDDIVIALDNVGISTLETLSAVLESCKQGDSETCKLVVKREGEEFCFDIDPQEELGVEAIASFDKSAEKAEQSSAPAGLSWFAIIVAVPLLISSCSRWQANIRQGDDAAIAYAVICLGLGMVILTNLIRLGSRNDN